MEATIYALKNKTNNMYYVGQTVVNPKYRLSKHFCDAFKRGSTQKVHQALREFGKESFDFIILEHCDKSELNRKETFWIQKLDSINSGYNEETSSGTDEQDYEKMAELFESGMSITDISKMFHTDRKNISKRLKVQGYNTNKYNVADGHNERYVEAKKRYLNGESLRKIEKDLHIDRKKLARSLKEENILVISYKGKNAHPYKNGGDVNVTA